MDIYIRKIATAISRCGTSLCSFVSGKKGEQTHFFTALSCGRENHIRSLMSVYGEIKITELINPQVTIYCLNLNLSGLNNRRWLA